MYRAYGLTVGSEIELPELLAGYGEAEVCIQKTRVPENLRGSNYAKPNIQKNASQTLLMLKNRAGVNLLISNGNRIDVDVFNPTGMARIRLAILGFGITALLNQRGLLVLHGNAVLTPARAIAICGEQGAGKSTLTAALTKKGCSVIADDLCAVDLENSVPTMKSGFPAIKLWPATLDNLNIGFESLTPVVPGTDKRYLPLTCSFHDSEEALSIVVILKKAEVKKALARRLSGIEKLNSVCGQIRSFTPEQLPLGRQWLLQKSTRLTKQVDVIEITRPISGNSIDEVSELVLRHCA